MPGVQFFSSRTPPTPTLFAAAFDDPRGLKRLHPLRLVAPSCGAWALRCGPYLQLYVDNVAAFTGLSLDVK